MNMMEKYNIEETMAFAILDFISSEGESFGERPKGLQYEWISKS